ncbi:MAG: hypothetical protein ACI35R_14880 [Bacillus sp. (in: firmicutes)]
MLKPPYITYTPYTPYIPVYYTFPNQNTSYLPHFENRPNYPPVDPSILIKSAQKSTELLNDAQKVSHGFTNSSAFSKQLIEAAQQSKNEEVKRLLSTLATNSKSEIHYNPDGIHITFKPKEPFNNCCIVTLSLKWGNI